MNHSTVCSEERRDFPRTRWSLVLAATGAEETEAAAALETVCRAYWEPLYTYVRRCGHSPHDAQDLTQEFFRRLLEKRWLASADREKGRLRTFLIVMLKHFMSKDWRRNSAQRRGGGMGWVEFDTAFAESHYAADARPALAPEEAFDRQWALTLLDRTMERLGAEFAAVGKSADFEALKECLMAGRGAIDYGMVAARLGVSEGAARVAAHRIRKRFREIFRAEISQTLAEGVPLEEEMRHLAAALA